MRVQDVMTKAVQTVSPATGAEQAFTLMQAKSIHHLVVTEGSRVVGVLSDRDVGGRRGSAIRKNSSVEALMTPWVVAVPPQTTLRKAANLMRGRSIGSLVVKDGSRILGILTISDLLELVGRGIDRGVQTNKRWTLTHRSPHKRKAVGRGLW